ncbi:MAG: hypothetical protein ABWX69_03830 [Arthrobacter sp.]
MGPSSGLAAVAASAVLAKMAEIVDLAHEAGVHLRLARPKPAVRATLAKDGGIERIGEDMIDDNLTRRE